MSKHGFMNLDGVELGSINSFAVRIEHLWNTVISYLKGISETVADGIDQAPPLDGAEVTDNTMELLRYEELSKLMHPELVDNLHNSAASVADYCRLFAVAQGWITIPTQSR